MRPKFYSQKNFPFMLFIKNFVRVKSSEGGTFGGRVSQNTIKLDKFLIENKCICHEVVYKVHRFCILFHVNQTGF